MTPDTNTECKDNVREPTSDWTVNSMEAAGDYKKNKINIIMHIRDCLNHEQSAK